MMKTLKRPMALAGGLLVSLLPAAVQARTAQQGGADTQTVEARIDDLKALKKEMVRMMRAYDARIQKLEAEVRARPKPVAQVPAATPVATPAVYHQPIVVVSNTQEPATPPPAKPDDGSVDLGGWGTYVPGKGYVLAEGRNGGLYATLIAYARYLNQTQLDPTYTDSFGRTFNVDRRQDVQWNKVNLGFRGWLFDPNFTFRAWVWTQQPGMGEGAQVVVGGQIGYRVNDYFSIYAGIAPLPSTRSTNWTYPFWLKMDNRTVADEFFRASYSQGIWAEGKIADGLEYRVMIANNLSALGVSASQLDAEFSTLSGAIWWMPTTGEFGPAEGFGDFEGHTDVATLFGVHYTRSREDKQTQAGVNDFENSQIRLSDGTLVFSNNAFNTGGRVDRATYQMADLEAGIKYLGFSLEAEYYLRWVNDFITTGFVPVTSLFDHGFQVQASAMVIPKQLQVYVSGSTIFGQYGDPWDVTIGTNWYPFSRREVHINAQAIYLDRSPVGGTSYPYVVGGNGWLFNTDFIITF
jgi:hypothetical protein